MYNIFRAIHSDSGSKAPAAKRTLTGTSKTVEEADGEKEGSKYRRNEKYYKSVRTVYVIKGGKKRKKSFLEKYCLDADWNIFLALWKAIRSIPYRIRVAFLGTMLIPQYRPEWGMYIRWNPKYPTRSDEEMEERERKKQARFKKKVISREEKSEVKWKQAKAEAQRREAIIEEPPQPVAHDHTECLQIRINVSGLIFEPQVRTLRQFPNTLLGNPRKMMRYYDPERDEFFFDRHRTSFEAILSFYQTGGIIRKPPILSFDHFMEEVKFFELGHEIIRYLEDSEGVGLEEEKPLTKGLFRRKLWLLFEYPESSYQSRIVAYVSVLAVCLSIFEFCIETMPEFQWQTSDYDNKSHPLATDPGASDTYSDLEDPFFLVETICVVFFVFEYVMRALTSPNIFIFIKEFSNLIDLVAIIPYFVSIAYQESDEVNEDSPNKQVGSASLTVFRIIRLVRVFRILKLSRHNKGLKILGKTLKASGRELGLLVFFLLIGVVVFSSAMFFAELNDPDSHFDSIPTGFWFSVVTMTTLGYGDIVPITVFGKLVGALCAIAGVLTISLPVPVIVSNFNMFYNREELNDMSAKSTEANHVEQCPFYPGWYNPTGELIDGSLDGNRDSTAVRWLRGELQADHSDSDFEDLKRDEMLKRPKAKEPVLRRRKKHSKILRKSNTVPSKTEEL